MSWTDGVGTQTSVAVERSSDGVTFEQIATTSGISIAYKDPYLLPSSSYTYRVRAFNGPTPSAAYSNTATATTAIPKWQPITTAPPAPPALVNMGSTNVLAGNQMFICLGDDGSLPPSNTATWAFQYSGSGSPSWSSQGLGVSNPGARLYPAVAYDPLGQAVYLMGGQDASGTDRNDVWKLTQTTPGNWTWAQVGPIAGPLPPGRIGHAAVFSGSKLFIIAGQVGANVANDVWMLDLSSPAPFWTELFANPPMTPRWNLTAVVDTRNNQIVVFGGVDAGAYRNDTWSISLGATPVMSLITPSTSPPSGRQSMTAVYDSSAAMMIVFGGDIGSGTCANDVWALSLSATPTWTPVLVTGTPPGVRAGYAAIFDDSSRRLLLFGGLDLYGTAFYSDVWQLQF